jgi:hypothetical protein
MVRQWRSKLSGQQVQSCLGKRNFAGAVRSIERGWLHALVVHHLYRAEDQLYGFVQAIQGVSGTPQLSQARRAHGLW